MATIKEIAKACGVSVATVSNVLNGKDGASKETQNLVKKYAKEMNYTPNIVARNLKLKNTKSIGVIAEDMTIFSIPEIIDGITEHCEEVDYQILLINLRLFKKYNDTYYNKDFYYDTVRKEMQKLMSKQVEGIIYVAAHERKMHCIPDNLQIPAVLAYGYSENSKIPSVVVDDVDGASMIIQELIDAGHRRIGVVTGKTDSMHAQARLKAYQKQLFSNDILFDPDLVVEGDWSRPSGYACVDKLLEKGVTAIFSMNDVMAGGIYDRLEELGKKVGDDISVAGYDNKEVSGFYTPALTTVNLPLHDIGYKASDVLLKMLGENEADKKTIQEIYEVKCSKIIRKSVKKIG